MKFIILAISLLTAQIGALSVNGQIRQLNGSKISKQALTVTLQQIIDTAQITRLSVVIINGKDIIYKKTFGWGNKENNALLNDTTAMHAASFTKPVSAYLFLKLVANGTFDLDTPLVKYLKNPIGSYDKWKDLASDKLFEKVTPRMILSHSAGLPVVRSVYKNKVNLIAAPGTKFYYSNEGINLLGFVMEEYTGKKLQNLAKEFVFDPLFMKNTSMIWQEAFETNYALGYSMDGKAIEIDRKYNARAAGSMTTTASDYAKFVVAIMEKKGFSGKLFDQMLAPQIKIISKRGFGPQRDSLTTKFDKIRFSWGLGVGLFTSIDGNAFLHGGHDDGWQNYFVAYTNKKIAVIMMSNSENFEHSAGKILKVCIGDENSPLEWFGYYDN